MRLVSAFFFLPARRLGWIYILWSRPCTRELVVLRFVSSRLYQAYKSRKKHFVSFCFFKFPIFKFLVKTDWTDGTCHISQLMLLVLVRSSRTYIYTSPIRLHCYAAKHYTRKIKLICCWLILWLQIMLAMTVISIFFSWLFLEIKNIKIKFFKTYVAIIFLCIAFPKLKVLLM